jgi:hypothetical protein
VSESTGLRGKQTNFLKIAMNVNKEKSLVAYYQKILFIFKNV